MFSSGLEFRVKSEIMSTIFLYILILTISSITKVKSAENTTDPDRWVVYDNEEFDSKSSNHRLPSCILAEMKGKIETFGSIFFFECL